MSNKKVVDEDNYKAIRFHNGASKKLPYAKIVSIMKQVENNLDREASVIKELRQVEKES